MVNEVQTFFILPLLGEMIQFDEYLSSNSLVQPRNWFYSPSNPPFGGSMVYLLFPSILWCKPKFRVSQKKTRLIKGCFDPPFSREIDVGTSPERNVGNLLPQHGGSWTCRNESWWLGLGHPSRFLEKKTPKKTAGIFTNAAKLPGLLDVDLPWRCLASATRTDSSTMAMRVGLDCHVGYLDHPRTCG